MTTQTIDETIITQILTSLTTKPDCVQISRSIDEQGVLLTVKVDATDMGIVIGKGGSMATALKTVIKAVGKANNNNIRIIFEEPDNSTKRVLPVPTPEQIHNFDHDLDELLIN
jgi:uncharacterized protein